MQTFSQLPAAKQTSKNRLFNTLHKSWIHQGDEMVQEPLIDNPPESNNLGLFPQHLASPTTWQLNST